MKLTLLLLVVAIIGFTSCEDDFPDTPIEVVYDTAPFDLIELYTSSDISIIQSNFFQVVVNGRESDVNDTEVLVIGNQLIIEEFGNIDQGQIIKIFVPVINKLESFGSSDVYGESQFRQNGNMDLRIHGSGEIDMYVDTDNLDVLNTGSGDFSLEGFCDNLDIELTGSGWIRTFNLNSDFCDVNNKGSGSVEVYVDNDLDVFISGSGDVFYKGQPSVSSQINGSGKLINAN
jgi:hypothetical protein